MKEQVNRAISIFFLFSISSLFLIAEDITTFEIEDIMSRDLTIIDKFSPTIRRQLNGRRFILTYSINIRYYAKDIWVKIYYSYNSAYFPYDYSGLRLLKKVYERESITNNLFPEGRQFFDDRDIDISFSKDYKPRDLNYIPCYKSDIIYSLDGTRIERDFTIGNWPYTGPLDKLTYYIPNGKGLFSEYIIEFYGIWETFWRDHDESLMEPKLKDYQPPDGGEEIIYLYTLTNEELAAYPDQDDPSIRLLHLLNEAMATFRFKDRPNAPPANLAVVNDNRVRLRTDYTLEGEILGHVNTGEEVIVMEQSPRQETIGNQTSYWYKVVSKESYIKGWMFGSFLDFIEE